MRVIFDSGPQHVIELTLEEVACKAMVRMARVAFKSYKSKNGTHMTQAETYVRTLASKVCSGGLLTEEEVDYLCDAARCERVSEESTS